MGQRLVITIHAFDEDIAKIYYHWSAYTMCALNVAQDIVENVDWESCTSKDELILKITKHIEKSGGGVDYSDRNAFAEKYPNEKFNDAPSRNDGLIAITSHGMGELQYWSEGDLTINFDEQTVQNYVFFIYDSREELLEYFDESELDNIKIEDFPELDSDPREFEFGQFEDIKKILQDGRYFRYDNAIYELTE